MIVLVIVGICLVLYGTIVLGGLIMNLIGTIAMVIVGTHRINKNKRSK